MAKVFVLKRYALKKSLITRSYSASYTCPNEACRSDLKSSESEIGNTETCPNCRVRFRLSPEHLQQTVESEARLLEENQNRKAEAALAKQRKQEQQAKELAEERERLALAAQQAEAARATPPPLQRSTQDGRQQNASGQGSRKPWPSPNKDAIEFFFVVLQILMVLQVLGLLVAAVNFGPREPELAAGCIFAIPFTIVAIVGPISIARAVLHYLERIADALDKP